MLYLNRQIILYRLLMQAETLRDRLLNQLKTKSAENSTYRKALTIYESILQSTKEIPNFFQNFANTDANFALFVFGSAYKLLAKQGEAGEMRYNVDGMLMIINMVVGEVNVGAIKGNGILKDLQMKVFELVRDYQAEQRTPLMIRLAISILSFTLINTDNPDHNPQSTKILQSCLTWSIQSHRTNILSKQCSKMLTHLVKHNPAISKLLSQYATMTMLGDLDSPLFLNNVREVLMEFPLQLVNDIGYRMCQFMGGVECTSQDEEVYLAQAYYLLQKLSPKFSTSTLQQLLKHLISTIPTAASQQTGSKILHCYIQALHTLFQSLILTHEKIGNRYISSIVAILQEFITKGGRVEKQAVGVMRAVLGACVRKSLWVGGAMDEEGEEELDIQGMGLEEGKRGSDFSKLVCMLEGMLSDEYPNYRATSSILCAFFDSLDSTATPQLSTLIHKIICFRQKFDDKSYKKLMHSIFGAVSIGTLIKIYPVGVQGDLSDEGFEDRNNLWLVYCTEKYDGQEDFGTFMQFYYPLLVELKGIVKGGKVSAVRVQAYKNLVEMLWRCLKVFCRKPSTSYPYETLIELIKTEITQANDSTLDHISMALENLCSALMKKEYECKWAGNLISLLAKTLSLQKNNSKQILRAIKYLSSIADREYMTRVFDKNIVKLIQEKEKGTLNAPDNVQNNLKNLQILIAVSKGINFYDPSVVAPFKISREELVVRLIGDLIEENSLFQKKAYKYIFETIGLMGSSYLTEVMELLQANQHKIMAASKHYRLAILMFLWNRLSQADQKIEQTFTFIKKYLPEILMDMRESNQRARRQATALFQAFCSKILEMGLLENFVEIMCAGLAVDSTETKVSTLNGLTQIYYKKYEIPLEFSVGILEIVLLVLYEQKSQIYKAVVQFCRRFIFSFQKTKQINHILSTVLEQLFKADIGSKMQNRSVLKHFLLKLTKRFNRETVEKLIPAEDRKILGNAIKTQNREKRKKKERLTQRRLEMENARKLRNQEEDSEENQEEGNEHEQGEAMEVEENQELKQIENPDNLLLKYDLQQQNFHFEQDKYHIKTREKKQKSLQKSSDPITFEDGIMIVKEDPRRKREQKLEQESDKQGEQKNETQQNSYLNIKKKRKLNDIHEVKESGATFRSHRAGGDLQLKDKPSPYAFIQFNSKALNKRFKKRAEKVFDTVFERSEGGLKGIKSRIAGRGH